MTFDPYPHPRWSGEPLGQGDPLVHGEQGVGDEILFASCYDDLLRAGAALRLGLRPAFGAALSPLVSAGQRHWLRAAKDHQPVSLSQPVDWQIPAGSVPQILSPPDRRLSPPPAISCTPTRSWSTPGAAGSELGRTAASRHLVARRRTTCRTSQALDQSGRLATAVGRAGRRLDQSAIRRHELRTCLGPAGLGVTIHDWPEGDPLVDLDGFAGRLAALDLVIWVGNATVHLAGALGVTAWAILPQTPNWRWGLNGEQSALVLQRATGAATAGRLVGRDLSATCRRAARQDQRAVRRRGNQPAPDQPHRYLPRPAARLRRRLFPMRLLTCTPCCARH